jgi:hypothetical protein
MSQEDKDAYTEAAIKERFDEFGGIMRYVLPRNHRNALISARGMRASAIPNCNPRNLLDSDLESQHMHHLLAQYEVEKKGPEAFKEFRMQLVPCVMPMLRTKLSSLSLLEMRDALVRNDQTGNMEKPMRDVIERLVAKHLTSAYGVKWRERSLGEAMWTEFGLKLPIIRIMASYHAMKKMVLYFPYSENSPLVDMYYKEEDGSLVGIQVTTKAFSSLRP